jgi:predicted ATPase
VFICHASTDASAARRVAELLEEHGVQCWIAPRDIAPGDNYTQAILDALAAAPVLVLMFSAAADSSPHVRRELEMAVGSNTAIVPVRLEVMNPSAALRYFIGTSQWLDAVGIPPETWEPVLVRAVRKALRLIGQPPAPEPERAVVEPATAVRPRPGAAAPVPPPRSPTWGRDELRRHVLDLVSDGSHRLVTLTGLGGIGKTRVATVVAADVHQSGRDVRFLAPAEMTSPEQLTQDLATALGADGADPAAVPPEVAGGSGALVVLDNLEVVPGAGPLLSKLIQTCPGLTFLVTSRVALGIPDEREVQVPPLEVPTPDAPRADVLSSPAVQLLVSTATQTSPTFRVEGNERRLGELCRLLDGVPLAIELAAARLKSVGLDRVHASLAKNLDLLTTGSTAVPERHRALTTTIAWSFDRLDELERTVCERLAVFEGWFTFEAVEAVCTDLGMVFDALTGLVDAGLLRTDDARTDLRYAMPSTVRTFARGNLESAAEATVRETLAEYLLGEVRRWGGQLDTADGPLVLDWFADAATDVDAAIDTSLRAGRVDHAVDLTLASAPFWVPSGRMTQEIERTRRVLGAVPADSSQSARLHAVAGRLAYQIDDFATATTELQAALDLGEKHADEVAVAYARCYLGGTLLRTGKVEEGAEHARLAFEDSERLDLYPLAAEALAGVAISHAVRGSWDEERSAHERRLEIARDHGDVVRTSDALNTLAEIALDEDDAQTAASYAAESLELAAGRLPLESRDATITLARAAVTSGRHSEASALLRRALDESGRLGLGLATAQCLRVGGCLASHDGNAALAVRLFAAAQRVFPSPSGTDVPVERDLAAGLEAARAELGPERSEREWRLGSGLPLATVLEQLDEALGPPRT